MEQPIVTDPSLLGTEISAEKKKNKNNKKYIIFDQIHEYQRVKESPFNYEL